MKKKSIKNPLSPIDIFHRNFWLSYNNMTSKNWRTQLLSYFGEIKKFSGDNFDERIVTGWVAGLCERAYYLVAHEKDEKTRQVFKTSILTAIKLGKLPYFLNHSGSVVCGKRQPSFTQSLLPTLERYEVMERLSGIFAGKIDSIIIGGSMSYSPFFGIRENKKNKDFSDIDALVVINDSFFKKSGWGRFMKDKLFLDEEKMAFLGRIPKFGKLLNNKKADVFSQRFLVQGKMFTVSIHFVTFSVFERMVVTDLENDLKSKRDSVYVMNDFRVLPFKHPCHARHTFNGQRIETVIEGYSLGKDGFISQMPGYIISNQKFYPGVYQTIISTAFLVFYDKMGATKKLVEKFKKIIYREADRMSKKFPASSYAKAHNRYDIFPPGRFEEGCNSYLTRDKTRNYITSDFKIIFPETESIPINYSRPLSGYDDKNNEIIEKYKIKSDKWKKNVLKKAELDIINFINVDSFNKKMMAAKKQGLKWCDVAVIPGFVSLSIKLTYPYKKNVLKKALIHEGQFTKIITPWEIMRLKVYERLARMSSKVYVSSIFDPSGSKDCLPAAYSIIVPVI